MTRARVAASTLMSMSAAVMSGGIAVRFRNPLSRNFGGTVYGVVSAFMRGASALLNAASQALSALPAGVSGIARGTRAGGCGGAGCGVAVGGVAWSGGGDLAVAHETNATTAKAVLMEAEDSGTSTPSEWLGSWSRPSSWESRTRFIFGRSPDGRSFPLLQTSGPPRIRSPRRGCSRWSAGMAWSSCFPSQGTPRRSR
jgi:hypothetical protein